MSASGRNADIAGPCGETLAASSPPVVPVTLSTAICSGLPLPLGPAILSHMGTKSRETIYGASIRAAAERATEARKDADRLAVEAWNKRMLGFQGPGTAVARARRRDQRRVCLSRSEMPWL